MNTNNVKLQPLNKENWYTCCQLQVDDQQQQFLEPNAVSIAQSKFEQTLQPVAILVEEQVVGFLMYNTVPEELDGYWVYRIMVDKEYQKRGIGKVATALMLNEMAQLPNARKIIVGYHPENLGAHLLYASIGFVDEGHRFGKEMAVIKYLND